MRVIPLVQPENVAFMDGCKNYDGAYGLGVVVRMEGVDDNGSCTSLSPLEHTGCGYLGMWADVFQAEICAIHVAMKRLLARV